MNALFPLSNQILEETIRTSAIEALESGKIIFLPQHPFHLHENEHLLISDRILDQKCKNISYDYYTQRLNGIANETIKPTLHQAMQRYATYAHTLINDLFPQYQSALRFGRTSYRPAEIKNRTTSKRKDDTRLHVDAFPSTPVNGLRILRVFSNVNPHQQPRVWHVGEAFPDVLNRFASRIPTYRKTTARFLKCIKATKSLRTSYDHYMLHLHDQMKLDDEYQNSVSKQRIDFPAESSWIVFTDQVSHAALSGQFLFEQTFYLPVNAMKNASLSPLKQVLLRQPDVLKQFA